MELCRGAFVLLVLIYCSCSAQNLNLNGTLDVPINDTESPPAESRIIGGSPATKHQFPYQVAIITNDQAFCGGSLISSTAVLTAAHCTNKYELGSQSVLPVFKFA
ncbi:hypothetical protein B566_EDAN011637 [Ephemera danica]|nr:hypothetical protein B566_EDAN011637 [Ephemera danica]